MGLWGVREAAKRDTKLRFTALLHHITPELLLASYLALKRSAAPGVDGVTWQAYGRDLEERLADLHRRVHRGAYRAQPSKRAWIPKTDGRQGKPETFNFLGFTHCCGTTRQGAFTIKRKSIAKRMRAKLQAIKQQLRERMHAAVVQTGRWLRTVVQGWFNYHAVPGNIRSLNAFRTQVQHLWLRILRKRSQKGRNWSWERMNRLARTWLPKAQILHPYPSTRLIVINPR
jgi:hypothetical protein